MDLAINNLQRFICHKTQTEPNQTEPNQIKVNGLTLYWYPCSDCTDNCR